LARQRVSADAEVVTPKHYAGLVKNAILIVAALLVAAIVAYWRWTPELGVAELQRSQNAVLQTTSWRFDSTGNSGGIESARTVEVTCPGDKRESTHYHSQDGRNGSSTIITYQGEIFSKINDDPWERSAPPEGTVPLNVCGTNAPINISGLYNIGELKLRGKLTKKDRREIDGVKCQWWDADFGYQWPPVPNYSVCIAPDTHLPRQINFTGNTIRFSGWNSTEVQPPDLTESQAPSDGSV
jgi:hypothetical protein